MASRDGCGQAMCLWSSQQGLTRPLSAASVPYFGHHDLYICGTLQCAWLAWWSAAGFNEKGAASLSAVGRLQWCCCREAAMQLMSGRAMVGNFVLGFLRVCH